jgi:plastocyanin
MKFGAIILILGIFLIGAGIYLLTSQNPSSGPNNTIPNTTNNNSPATTENTSTVPKTYNINMLGYAFSPSSLTIKSGDTVVWKNLDSMSHTVTSDSGNELSSSSLGNGGTYSHTFSTAGTFAYHCAIHASMKGTIIVG